MSVVIPVHNSEEWLDGMFDSLALQTIADWEAIVVLDGPTDGSGEIARAAAKRDNRVRVYEVENGGAGRARNIGIHHANGRFVALFDSDDLVPPDALNRLVSALMGSGSDVVTAAAMQTTGALTGLWPYWTMRDGAHRVPAMRVTLSQRPELVLDHTVWNKLYRAEFLREQAIGFPEGTTCEDLVFSARVFAEARSIDIIGDVTYIHRRRPGSVTTSGHFSQAALTDWIEQSRALADVIDDFGDERVSFEFYRRMLKDEAWTRASRWTNVQGETGKSLASACAGLFLRAPQAVSDALPASKFAIYSAMAAEAHVFADLLTGEPIAPHDLVERSRRLRALIGEDRFESVRIALCVHNVLEPILHFDAVRLNEIDLREADALVRELMPLDFRRLLDVRMEAAAIVDAVAANDSDAIARIRYGAARPAPARGYRWVSGRRSIELRFSEDTRIIGASWVGTRGDLGSVETVTQGTRVRVPLPDAIADDPDENCLLLVQRENAPELRVAVLLSQDPIARRWQRGYAHRSSKGYLVARDRGSVARRLIRAIRRRVSVVKPVYLRAQVER